MKKIPLTKGKFSIVDDEDYERVSQWKWFSATVGYAARSQHVIGTRIPKRIHMHRIIVNCPDDMEVDHINHDKLDNRKCNLRICSKSQNAANRKIYKKSTSKYRGVSWDKKNHVWRCVIMINKIQKWIGRFESELEAAKAYNEAARKYFGEFARLNEVV